MAIGTTYTDPSEAGSMDLDTNDILTDTVWDLVMSDIKALGGTDGYTGTKHPAKGTATATGTITTASASYVDMTTMSVTLTVNSAAANLRVHFAVNVWHSVNTETTTVALSLDAAGEVCAHAIDINAGAKQDASGVYVFATPGAGSHTIKIRWKTTAATASAGVRNLAVVEEL